MVLLSSDAMFLWSFSLGISYAELRYDVPSNISTVGSEPSASVNSFECNNLSNDHKEAESANHKGGTLFSVTGNSKPPLRRTPTDYDLPPLPAPRKQPGEKKLSDPTHDDNKDIQLPVRNRLRETNDNNKENSIDEVQVDHLVAKGYDRLRVVDALRVARNNMTMAEEILETFVRHWGFMLGLFYIRLSSAQFYEFYFLQTVC